MALPYARFERIWKKFHRGEFHDSLRDLVPAMANRLVGRAPPPDRLAKGDFWALRDVSFLVEPGDVLGIIGPNGAGKSTILKVLTRIHRPDRGRSEVRGRIGALIEIAAGFHPDLTGIENVYLQGSIMGMRTDEIDQKLDRIIEFAGIPEFADTQVKRYSSGMNARLGFAIAAHLDPDVLIIDEVLAVGDFAFQAKAFERMQEMARREIPVIVVSHQLDRVASLCTKAILLDRGRVSAQGEPGEVIGAYLEGKAAEDSVDRDTGIVLDSVSVETVQPVESGGQVRFQLMGRMLDPSLTEDLSVGFRLRRSDTGQVAYATDNKQSDVPLPPPGRFALQIEIEANLAPGIYTLEPLIWDHVARSEAGIGPGSYLHVAEGPRFSGVAQCNARLEFEADRQDVAGSRDSTPVHG